MEIEQVNIESIVEKFISKSHENDRYCSFDYCYNYFHPSSEINIIKDMEKSCLVLGFYLASWGMYRGSSFLLDKSVKYYSQTIEYIASTDKCSWNIDVDNYNQENIREIKKIYDEIKFLIIKNNNADLTLVTKILLGVFGFVPAFDSYFCNTFRTIYKNQCGFRKLNDNSLSLIHDFYINNNQSIDNISKKTFTRDFKTGEKSKLNYPKAKIIDMFGFQCSLIEK